MAKLNVGVVGHTGRLGKPLVEILSKHPHTKISYTESRKEGKNGDLSSTELIFLALPYGESEGYLPRLKGKSIIDLSIDHRNDNDWVYGLPEYNRDQIKIARHVANPGCYATAILEALYPIREIIDNIRIKAYSGVSGRPNQPIDKDKGMEKYSEGRNHSQVAEIEKFLGKQIVSLETNLVYPLKTGILAKIDANLLNAEKFGYLFNSVNSTENNFLHFGGIHAPDDSNKLINYLKENLACFENSNLCQISFAIENFKCDKADLTINSVLDNLIKGGAGQAVQNMNLMFGFKEYEGLI